LHNHNKIGWQFLCLQLAEAGDKDLSLKVYQACGSSTKIMGALAEKGDISELVRKICKSKIYIKQK